MNAKLAAALVMVIFLVSALSCAAPQGLAQENNLSFTLLNQADRSFNCTLNVLVPQSLSQHYENLSHRAVSDQDFPIFVTPYAVGTLVPPLRQIYPNDEDFANGVLDLVHQIPYEEIATPFYPVETLLMNRGDCDMFSFLAASIMKAGGLDVVLLRYLAQNHMNIGVHLDEAPKEAQREVGAINYNGIKYYVAECTTSNWKNGWRVGECPPDLKGIEAVIIPLEDVERTAPGQISASFKKLQGTTLTLSVSPALTAEGITVSMNGQISPALPYQNVTLLYRTNGGHWEAFASTLTGRDGKFLYAWKAEVTGQVNLRASWIGNKEYAGSISANQETIILPFYIVILIFTGFGAGAIYITTEVLSRKNRRKNRSKSPNTRTEKGKREKGI
ncbi:MAG: hypothetical protein NWF05_06280 [Candidatus Bathyarchaeota archaeon]|nr:hypothetical protein [Candidatus Bathyarchaeota archaeon]